MPITAQPSTPGAVRLKPFTICMIDHRVEDADAFKKATLAVLPGSNFVHKLSGHTGLRYLNSADPLPGIVLIATDLPDLSGLDVLRVIRAQPRLRRLITVMIAPSDDQYTTSQSYANYANAHLMKPVTSKGTTKVMQALIGWLKVNRQPPPPDLS